MIRALLVLVFLASPASAQSLANQLFGAMQNASEQPAEVFGTYAKGCFAGGAQLPETGPTWQAMRLSRERNWGHPDLVAFVERLSRAAVTDAQWPGIYVGDMSQPRGGPMTSGHQSHQLGLDVDIWMLRPDRLNLNRAERESLSSISVRSSDQTRVNQNFTYAHIALLRAAALDPAVDRIFVTPPVKIAMCNAAEGNKDWLQKIRPLQGHHYHFHVRLKCPRGDRICETQRPTVRDLSDGGNGCDATLNWWVTDYLNPPPRDPNAPTPPPRRGARDYTMADLPRQCADVLASN
jgi:penicillin-insensitive murein endopeptidase